MSMRSLLTIAVMLSFAPLASFGTTARAATSSPSMPSPFGGNGHTVTFDGRLFVAAHGDGWVAQVLLPEMVGTAADGVMPDVSVAFTPPVLIQPAEQCENALALCHPSAESTPYACDDAGAATGAGPFACYDLVAIDSNACGTAPNDLRRRALKIWIADPSTSTARIHRHEWLEERTFLGTTTNGTLKGIEPTITRDGKLLVWQGHPNNNGEIDALMYATNDDACAVGGWRGPFNLSHMVNDPVVNTTYRLAERVLRAADGDTFDDGDIVRGAYPWIFPDGDAINFTSVTVPCRAENDPAGCGPRRGGIAVLGYPTNWGVAHVDGGVNPDTDNTVRLFFSSPGPTTFATLPRTEGIDVWPFFGSNTQNYAEIVFDDGLDGRYAGVWLMNESVTIGGDLDRTRTPDTSGYFNTGLLEGFASFPLRNEGPRGKTIVFNGISSRVRVPHDVSLDAVNAITVEMTLRPDSPVSCDDNNNWRVLLDKGGVGPGAFSLVFEEGETFQARVRAGGEERALFSNASIAVGQWSDIAFSYQASTGRMSFYVNGVETNSIEYAPALLDASSDDLLIGGPGGLRPSCPDGAGAFNGQIEELRVSRIDRFHDEPIPTEGEGEGEEGEGEEGEGEEGEGEEGEGEEGEGEGEDGELLGPGIDPLGNDDNDDGNGGCAASASAPLLLVLLALLRRRRA